MDKESPVSSISLLERTRKDFQLLLSEHSDSKDKNGANFQSSKKKKIRVEKAIEMEEKTLLQDVTKLEGFEGLSNPALFWYEQDNNRKIPKLKNRESLSAKSSDSEKSIPSYSSETNSAERLQQPRKIIKTKNKNSLSVKSIESKSIPVSKSSESEKSISSQSSETNSSESLQQPLKIIKTKNKNSLSAKSIESKSIPVSKSSESEKSISSHSSEADSAESFEQVAVSGEDYCLRLFIHQTGHLVLDQSKSEIIVIVHAINIETGLYIQNDGTAVSPQFTSCWKASGSSNSTSCPTWNQQLNFKFDVKKYLPSTIFLFELINKPSRVIDDRFSQIAWAFFRPISRLGVSHSGQRLNVQLQQVPAHNFFHHTKPNVSDLFHWYQTAHRVKYPCVLYITLEPTRAQSGNNVSAQNSIGPLLKAPRAEGQLFKLPNTLTVTVAAGSGALTSCFSDDASHLAIALTSGLIRIYDLSDTHPVLTDLKGHRGNVYDLQWRTNSTSLQLVSSGADCSARLWDLSCSAEECLVLAHPAFVYSARFSTASARSIATGCYDHVIRLWNVDNGTAVLLGCCSDHTAPVNCLCWATHGLLYSADTRGSVLVWNMNADGLQFER